MTEKEKLIDLLCYIPGAEEIADFFLANGVTIPVKCKDCKLWMYEYDDIGLCVTDVPDVEGVQRRALDFCSLGERKDNDSQRKSD